MGQAEWRRRAVAKAERQPTGHRRGITAGPQVATLGQGPADNLHGVIGMTVTRDRLYRSFVDERYRVLREALRLERTRPDWGLRLEQAAAIRHEIRALVRIRWFARRQERLWTRLAAVHAAKDYHSWQSLGPVTEPELLAGYGLDPDDPTGDFDRDSGFRESQPEFSGAFR